MKLEKQQHFDKAVGVPSEYKDRQDIFEKNLAKFVESAKEKMDGELEKTDREMAIIAFAEESVVDYMGQYGRDKDVPITLQNIHILKDGGVKRFTSGKLTAGAASPLYGDIIVDRKKSDIDFALVIFHELFHLKSYNALQLTEGKKPGVYRGGFSVYSRDGSTIYFKDVEEAIVGYMEKRFYDEVLSRDTRFQKQVEELQGVRPSLGRVEEQRKGMLFIDKLFEANKDRFQNKDEIIDLFVEAQVTGNLLKIARLIEKSFGKGSFRDLGEKTKDR